MGFSDGYIRGYSKSGQPVMSEQLHMDAVTKITFMWSSPILSTQQVYIVGIVNLLTVLAI